MNRELYARITSLSLEELPVECIEGRFTGGSVNVDGASAVRRTCSLSMVADISMFNEYYWTLHTKFKLEIGVDDNNSGAIVWYPQGIFIITSINYSLSTSSCSINISGKDKMCQLNGENGGLLPFQVDFGTEEIIDNKGNIVIKKRPIKDIIRDAVHTYGNEPLHNIIIQDLDDIGLEIQTYRYDEPLYLLRKANENITPYIQASFDKEIANQRKLSDISYDIDGINGFQSGESFTFSKKSPTQYCAKKVEYGQSPGYIPTPLIYAGDLIARAGESIVSVFDKIKNQLGDFEYFYDINGTFIFRRQLSYLKISFTPLEQDSEGVEYVDPYKNEYQHYFTNHDSLTAFNNTPNLQELKNDFSIWGTRSSVTGKELATHLRYAIDTKPVSYTCIQVSDTDPVLVAFNQKNDSDIKGQDAVTYERKQLDWRELIYRMALDYFKYGGLDDFSLRVAEANPTMIDGRTGYEQYYTDMQGFWRQLYATEDDPVFERVYDASTSSIENLFIRDESGNYQQATVYNENTPYYKKSDSYSKGSYGWHKNVTDNPELLPFWIDFLDAQGELAKYSVKAIGIRAKVVNDKDVKAIYYRDIPSISWGQDTNKTESVIQLGIGYEKMFVPSTQGKSALEALQALLYNHACVIESISITTVPVYDLKPNQKIYVEDSKTGISGEYIVSKITVPLNYNGTMNVTATKVINRIL